MIKNFIIVICVSFFSTTQLKAQKGTIVYNQTINLHKNLSAEQQIYKAIIPETVTQQFQFIYNKKHGSYKSIVSSKSNGNVSISMQGPSGDMWCDFSINRYRNYIEVDGTLFHCEKEIKMIAAKPTGKKKKILGYVCNEYVAKGGKYHAWICDDLPKYITPMEPFFFNGAVLELKGENISYEAVDIFNQVDDIALKPIVSKAVTLEQYQDLKEEKRGELSALKGKVIHKQK